MHTIAIGDIHGSLPALQALLPQLNVAENRLVFLGDYIDRGPHSRQVLDALVELARDDRHVFLRGNHDDWLLNARTEKRWFREWIALGVGGRATLESYGAAKFDASALALIPDEHFAFLEGTHTFYQTEYEIFVHASLSWLEPEETDSATLLWGSFNRIPPHPSGKRVICAHTAQATGLPLDRNYAVCIDTFCYGGGWLTALNVDTDEVIQADNSGEVRRYSLYEMPAG